MGIGISELLLYWHLLKAKDSLNKQRVIQKNKNTGNKKVLIKASFNAATKNHKTYNPKV
jgi:hypothetical protein